MWPRFGIKVGNSTVCVATSKEDGKIEVIANKHGNRVSHAVLLMDGDDIEVGLTAKQKLASKGMSSVVNNFQFMNKNLTDEQIANAMNYLTCPYDHDKGKYQLMARQQAGDEEQSNVGEISPYEVCVEFFKASFELARHCHILEEHPSAVLSIPNYYPTESWTLIAEAAKEAGFHVSQVIPEHTAAVLAYDHLLKQQTDEKRVLCIKSGGLLTSVSLFDINNGLIMLIGSAGPFYIGGKQFTDVINDFICSEFFKKFKLDPRESRRSIAKVQTAADDCKHILTSLQSTQIYIDSLMDGVDFNVHMSRARYEMLIQPVLNEFMTTLNQAVETILTGIETDTRREKSIDEIVIAGGTMKIPKIQATINSRYPDAQFNSLLTPDEVIAIGCAMQTLYTDDIMEMSRKIDGEMKCSCITDDIYVWHASMDVEKQQLVFEKGTLLPTEAIVEIRGVEITENGETNNEKELCVPSSSSSSSSSRLTKFNVQMSNTISVIEVHGVKSCDGGIYRIKAIAEEVNGLTKLTLVNAA